MIILAISDQIIGLFAGDFLCSLGQHGLLIGFSMSLIYFTIGYSNITNGQTIGKKALRIRVIDNNNKNLNISKSIVRTFIISRIIF